MPWTFYNSNGQRLSSAATNISVLDIDGATDIGAAIADADLFIIDDGAGGTNRKTAASRISTYVLPGQEVKAWSNGTDSALTDHYNIASRSNDSDGINTYTFTIAMGNTNYMVVTGTDGATSNDSRCIYSGSRATGSYKLLSSNAGSASGLTQYGAVFGDR